MYDMKTSAVTIRIEPDLQKLLEKVCRQSGRTRSDIIRDSLKRQLSIIRFEQLRRQVLPFAEIRGYLTDEDVALEALRDCRKKRACTVDELWHYAKICRIANVMRPYLEAIA